MDEWQTIFEQVKSITQRTQPLQQSLKQIITFARSNPALFDEPEYWDQAQRHDFRYSFAALTEWARQGAEALAPETGWQFLLLDLGDCPKSFRLYSPGGQKQMSEQRFRSTLSSHLIVGTSHLEGCFGPEVLYPFGQLFGDEQIEVSDHHVSELDDRLLDWTGDENTEFHGQNGYLLWLMLGSLALVEPFRDKSYCDRILKGRDKLYLLPGYEEIFFHAATVTSEGISYEVS